MPITRKFRFEDREIWKLSIEIGDALFDIADSLEAKNCFASPSNFVEPGLVSQITLQKDRVRPPTENSINFSMMPEDPFTNAQILLSFYNDEIT